jgi:DNA repair exonuclease SbcCD nuclease subunit
MRVAAIGDAHLGRSYLNVVTADGVNQRERDFEQSFEAAVDAALAQAPDVVVWLGDVFDHPRPTYRSFRVAQRALAKVRAHGLPCVVISGNHDTPRLPGTGSPYSALADTFGELHFAHRLAYERFELPGLVVHAVPQMMTVEATLEALAEADRSRSLDRTNLLLTHPRVTQVVPRTYADINEIELDDSALRADLVLLGHWHVHTRVREHVWYAGSTDTFTYADDPASPKGVVVLDTDTGAITHVPIEGQRRLVTLEPVYAAGLAPDELQQLIVERVAAIPDGAIARLWVDMVDPEAYRLVDGDVVRAAASHAMHLRVEPRFSDAANEVDLGEVDMDSMGARWERYLEGQDLVGFDRPRIVTLGRTYLAAAVEGAE